MSTITGYKYLILNDSGTPVIEGTTMKVVELILGNKAYGWSPEEMHFQYPHLSLGQIYSALAYYSDHQEEVEQELKKRLKEVNQLEKASKPSSLKARLRAEGLLE